MHCNGSYQSKGPLNWRSKSQPRNMTQAECVHIQSSLHVDLVASHRKPRNFHFCTELQMSNNNILQNTEYNCQADSAHVWVWGDDTVTKTPWSVLCYKSIQKLIPRFPSTDRHFLRKKRMSPNPHCSSLAPSAFSSKMYFFLGGVPNYLHSSVLPAATKCKAPVPLPSIMGYLTHEREGLEELLRK